MPHAKEWTPSRPIEPGLYWLYAPSYWTKPVVISVDRTRDGQSLFASVAGELLTIRIDTIDESLEGDKWFMQIEIPTLPVPRRTAS